MVWGMYLPRSGGPYGPYGFDEGPGDNGSFGGCWPDRLRDHYMHQLPQAQKDFYGDARTYAYCVYEKFLYECGAKHPGPDNRTITPIEDHEPLRFFQTEKPCKELASVFSLNGRMWAVDEVVKRLIERLEPGVHRFYPVEVRSPRGVAYPVQYFTFVVGQYFESFSPEKSRPESFKPNGVEDFHLNSSKKDIAGLTLRKSVFGGAHLWRERGFKEWLLCFSDNLAADLTGAGLKLPKYYRMISI